jgi:hypothetical protein
MATYRRQDYYVANTHEGRMLVGFALPAGRSFPDPVQKLRIEGEGLIEAPKQAVTAAEFDRWCDGLRDAGFYVGLQPL